jgi:hypothetical protein
MIFYALRRCFFLGPDRINNLRRRDQKQCFKLWLFGTCLGRMWTFVQSSAVIWLAADSLVNSIHGPGVWTRRTAC